VSDFCCTIPDFRCLLVTFWVNELIFATLMGNLLKPEQLKMRLSFKCPVT